jgi:hypothetical protein
MLPIPLAARGCLAALLLAGFTTLVLRVLLEADERGRLRQAWQAVLARGFPDRRRVAATPLPGIIASGATRDPV